MPRSSREAISSRAARRYHRSSAGLRSPPAGTSSSSPRRCARVRPGLRNQPKRRAEVGDGVAACVDDRTRRLELGQPTPDPRTELDDGLLGGPGRHPPREHDLDPVDRVDGHSDPPRPLRATDRVGQRCAGIAVVGRRASEAGRGSGHWVNQATVRDRRMPSFPRFTAPLSGDSVQLRLAAERDIPEILIAHQDDPELYVRCGCSAPERGRAGTSDRTGRYRACARRPPVADDPGAGIRRVPRTDRRPRGGAALWPDRPERLGRARIASGARVGSARAHRPLVDRGGGAARVQLFIDPGNTPMLATAAKAGSRGRVCCAAIGANAAERRDAEAWSLVTPDLATAPPS